MAFGHKNCIMRSAEMNVTADISLKFGYPFFAPIISGIP